MKHCLVIDDSSVIRKVTCRILEDMHFETSEAENGQEALERCKGRMPDVILLDWHIPVMGAFEFLTALKLSTDGAKRPKVVYCTTENDRLDIARALNLGADEYIMKPYDRAAIEAKFSEAGIA